MIKERIDQDLKAALLAGEKERVTTLRGLKSAILYVEVAEHLRETGLSDEQVMVVLSKEAKKRQESADLYVKGGNQEKADQELRELAIIEQYLPEKLSEDEIRKLIDQAIEKLGDSSVSAMGRIIGEVKKEAGASADGVVVARLVKERLSQ